MIYCAWAQLPHKRLQQAEQAQETGIPTVPTDFFHALLLVFLREKSLLLFFSLYILFWLSVPKGSLTKYLTAAADAVERTVSEVLYIRSHIFDTGREEEEESPSHWENKNEMISPLEKSLANKYTRQISEEGGFVYTNIQMHS